MRSANKVVQHPLQKRKLKKILVTSVTNQILDVQACPPPPARGANAVQDFSAQLIHKWEGDDGSGNFCDKWGKVRCDVAKQGAG